MSNTFLDETKKAIKHSGHKVTDIVFIGSLGSGHSCSWSRFKKLANVEYDAGFGSASVATDLRIVFSDGQTMWRGEYDGSEWWEYSKPAVLPRERRRVKRLIGKYWPSMEDLQNDSDTHHNPGLLKEQS